MTSAGEFMNRKLFGCGAVAMAAVLWCAGAFAQQKATSSATEQAWAGEEAYWRYVKAHDTKSYLALWADDFNGWPISNQHTIHRSEIAAFVTKGGSMSHVVAYTLERESVEVHGDAVVTFYRVKETRQNAAGAEVTTTYRMTHTWMKRGGAWKIVASMSAEEPKGSDE
jgi:ketosteroid isomerase-like protein